MYIPLWTNRVYTETKLTEFGQQGLTSTMLVGTERTGEGFIVSMPLNHTSPF